MTDDTPDDLDFSQMPTRVRAATSLLGSIGWKLMEYELAGRLKITEDALLETEVLTEAQRASLLAIRTTIKGVLSLPAALAEYKKPVAEAP